MPPMAFTGLVSNCGKMAKTATVTVTRQVSHPVTRKVINVSKKYLVHDPNEVMKLDDRVVIKNCPPISARKRFVFDRFVKRAQLPVTPSAPSTSTLSTP